MDTTTLLVNVKNLKVKYDENVILENVNVHASVGEYIYFIGKVGSGKSSLLKSLYCEISIEEGEATVAGFDLIKIKNRQIPMLRRKIGMVFQDFELMDDRNVFENLKFVLKATGWKNKQDIEIRINEVLESVGMLDKKFAMPSHLSGGERQSISIARAMLNNPPLIFADEPTGNLDPESAEVIMNLLYKLSQQGKTVVMVTHNHSFIEKYPGRTYLFENKTARDLSEPMPEESAQPESSERPVEEVEITDIETPIEENSEIDVEPVIESEETAEENAENNEEECICIEISDEE